MYGRYKNPLFLEQGGKDHGEKEAGINIGQKFLGFLLLYRWKSGNMTIPSVAYNWLHQGEQNLQYIFDSHVELTEIKNVRVYARISFGFQSVNFTTFIKKF